MSNPMPVVAVTSLLLEARIAVGPGVSVICGQASQLVTSLQAAIERGALGVISFGVAGGLVPHLAPGDWVIGSGVRTGDERYPADPRWSRRLLEAIPGSVHAEIAGADAPIRSDNMGSQAQWRSTWSPISWARLPLYTIFHLPFVARLLTRWIGTCRQPR